MLAFVSQEAAATSKRIPKVKLAVLDSSYDVTSRYMHVQYHRLHVWLKTSTWILDYHFVLVRNIFFVPCAKAHDPRSDEACAGALGPILGWFPMLPIFWDGFPSSCRNLKQSTT